MQDIEIIGGARREQSPIPKGMPRAASAAHAVDVDPTLRIDDWSRIGHWRSTSGKPDHFSAAFERAAYGGQRFVVTIAKAIYRDPAATAWEAARQLKQQNDRQWKRELRAKRRP